MTTKKAFNIELFLGIIATLIATLSVAIAVWEGVETRTHNRLSVKPILIFNKTFNISKDPTDGSSQTTMTLSVVNRGLGPAVVKTVALQSLDKKKLYPNWNKALQATNYQGQLLTSADLDESSVLEAGDEYVLLSVDWVPNPSKDIQVRIQYQSMYEETFSVAANKIFGQSAQ